MPRTWSAVAICCSAVLEDDAYGLMPESRPPPLASFLPEASYFIAGVSKLLTPGRSNGMPACS